MEIFWTIVTGVLVFLIGQAVLKFLFEPLQEFRRTVSEIAHALIEHANVYCNPGLGDPQKLNDVSSALRKLSSKLFAQMHLTPKYRYLSKILCFPSEKAVNDAATNLIGLANSVFASGDALVNASRANKIRKALGIYIPEGERDEP
jgi:hypothetical protein